MKIVLWLAIILVAAIHVERIRSAPPQSTLPPVCPCGDSCPCRGIPGVPVTFADGSQGVRFADGTYRLLAGTVKTSLTVGSRQGILDNSPNYSAIPNSSSGCRIVNGQMVCPTPRR